MIRIAIVFCSCILLVGCGESAADYRERKQEIKSVEVEQWRSEDRLQKQIDELRLRIEKIEAR